jgi:hypothetical protein
MYVLGLSTYVVSIDILIGILVRDDTAREKLQEQVGDVGLIMWVNSLVSCFNVTHHLKDSV